MTWTSEERALLEALARVIVPQAYDNTPSAADVVRMVEERLACAPVGVQRDFLRALRALTSRLARLAICSSATPFPHMPLSERAERFARWGHSRWPVARTVYQAVRRLILAAYYGSPGGHHDIGVLPPLAGRRPLVSWEGPLASGAADPGVVATVDDPTRVVTVSARDPAEDRQRLGVTDETRVPGRVDAIVIGSGAGGAVAAARLATAGWEVLILEAGSLVSETAFTDDEWRMVPRLYADAGLRATDDLSITLLQGAAVGGGTVVNWMIMLRTPDHVLNEWVSRHALVDLMPWRMEPRFDAIERTVATGEVPAAAHSPANHALLKGAAHLGWHARSGRLNVRGCVRAGTCSTGCRYGAKQSALVTFLPAAASHGARLLPNAAVDRIEVRERGGAAGSPPIKRVHVTVRDAGGPRAVAIDAPVVVVAAGAVETPALLIRSGLGGGGVGRYLRLHPTTAVLGEYDETIYPFAGIPLSTVCDHFAASGPNAYGFWIECPALGPSIAAAAVSGFGAAHRQTMLHFHRLAPFIALVRDGADVDDSNGAVTVDTAGRTRIRYRLGRTDTISMRDATRRAGELHFAAGASAVQTLHTTPIVARSPAGLAVIDHASYAPNDVTLFSAHVTGTCRMGVDSRTSGATPYGERHGVPGLYVADGSLLPTAAGVNPQETIMALASFVADAIVANS